MLTPNQLEIKLKSLNKSLSTLYTQMNSQITLVITQFVAGSNGYKIEVQTSVTRTYPTQCHLYGKVLSL
jgi:hypothetical protein